MNNEVIEATVEDKPSKKEGDIQLEITDAQGHPKTSFKSEEQLYVNMSWSPKLKGVKNIGIAIVRNSGEMMFGANTFQGEYKISGNSARYKTKLALGPGKYYLIAGCFGKAEHDVVSFLDEGPYFVISKDPDQKSQGLIRLDYQWLEASKSRDNLA
jgi:hypothetical protein